MSYKVFARKWRPQRFEEMLGQEPVLRALVNALDSDRLHHAYLFTGMRGVGKTSIARIFAKCLNCLENGVSSTPCGQCSACTDIEAGRFLDLIEVDAASRTRVEETRELLENVPYAPASGRYKVYLIDEVHMFSPASFNALLKTLEEPPEHVKFLLATTDPQKVPVTVLSRCLQFNLRRVAPDALASYLADILQQESIEAERAALELIARASEGSVRDSLSLTEQAVAFGNGAVRAAEVESMLGRVSVSRLLGLLEALSNGDIATLFARVEELAVYAPDFEELLGEILTLLHRLALMQSVPGSSDASQPGHEALARLAAKVAPEEVQLWYQIAQHARRDLPYSPDPRQAFDMTLLRLHTFRPQGAGEMPAARMGGQAATNPSASAPDRPPAADAGALSAKQAVPEPPADAGAATTHRLAVRGSVSARDAVTVVDAGGGSAGEGVLPVLDPAVTVAGGSPDAIDAGSWPSIVERLGLSGMPRQLASHCTVERIEGVRLVLLLETTQEHLGAPRFVERMTAALSAWAGTPLSVELKLAPGSVGQTGRSADAAPLDTPARRQAVSEEAALAEARRAIADDPKLQRLLADIDGTVDESSIRPRDRSTS